MRYVRFLFPLLLLAVAVPALAVCGYCDEYAACVPLRGLYQRCHYDFPSSCSVICVEAYSANCAPPGLAASAEPSSFSNGYRILAVTVEAPKAVAAQQKSPAVRPKKLKTTT